MHGDIGSLIIINRRIIKYKWKTRGDTYGNYDEHYQERLGEASINRFFKVFYILFVY